MSWFGVTPLKKFPTPVCRLTPIDPLAFSSDYVLGEDADSSSSASYGAFSGCRYVLASIDSTRFLSTAILTSPALIVGYGINGFQNLMMDSTSPFIL